MDSPVFRISATAITLLLVMAWLVLVPMTLFNLRSLLKIPKHGNITTRGHHA